MAYGDLVLKIFKNSYGYLGLHPPLQDIGAAYCMEINGEEKIVAIIMI